MNVILACTAVYGVFAPYTARGHVILDIQRNSSCDLCPSLNFPLISTSNPRMTRIRWKTSCRNSKSDLPSSNYPFKKWVRQIRFRVSATRFPPDSGHAGIGGGDEREIEGRDIDHSWNSAVYPEFRGLQPYKEQKLRKRLYMPISHSSFTVIDNASYHLTKSVVVKLSWFYHLVLLNPPYSPQFNPIELFFEALKTKIRGLRVEETLKLYAEDGIQRITDTINQINSSVKVRRFLKTFKLIRFYISNSHI